MPEGAERLDRTDSSSHGVKMDVVAEPAKPVAVLHHYALVTPPERYGPLLSIPVKVKRKHALQQSHPFCTQIRLRRLQRQMIVVSHHAKGMQHPPSQPACRSRTKTPRTLRSVRALVLEYSLPPIPAVQHMVEAAGSLESQSSRCRQATKLPI
jgi:hypothetical protein